MASSNDFICKNKELSVSLFSGIPQVFKGTYFKKKKGLKVNENGSAND